jgi:proteasome lid subunit RPN8/RPN11
MQEPTPKPAPTRDDLSRGEALGTIYDDAFPIFFHEDVLEEVLDYSERDVSRELGGFLVGGIHEDQRPYVEIRHFVPATEALSRAASLTFTSDTWANANRSVEEKYPDDIIVGWHHTHPNFGIFLSAYDLFIHKHFFGSPWNVALVVDPIKEEFGFYQWRGDEIVDCGFICVHGKSK